VIILRNAVVNFDEDATDSSHTFYTAQQFDLYDKKGNVKKYLDTDRGLTVDIQYNLGLKTLPVSHRISQTSDGQLLRLTRAGMHSSGVKYGEISKHYSANEYVSTKYEYNPLGNLIQTVFPGGFSYTYDYDYGMFGDAGNNEYHGNYFKVVPSRIKDPFNNTYEVLSNAFALPVRVKDVYEAEVEYKYDHFNRLLEFRGPYETDWTIQNKFISNRVAITKHNLGGGNILYTSMINDGLGRTVQTKKTDDA
jgi:hypothetical protein